jgi:hypothetical protein
MPFQIQTQEQDQWCWVAVSVSVDRYFSATSTFTQCSLARQVLGQDCCAAPIPCNTPTYLQDALQAVGRLRAVQPGSLSFGDTLDQIRRGFPIGVRIGWFGGGGHFVVIRGCHDAPGIQLLSIADPWFVDSIQDFDAFCPSYLGRGEWTDTFLLKNA